MITSIPRNGFTRLPKWLKPGTVLSLLEPYGVTKTTLRGWCRRSCPALGRKPRRKHDSGSSLSRLWDRDDVTRIIQTLIDLPGEDFEENGEAWVGIGKASRDLGITRGTLRRRCARLRLRRICRLSRPSGGHRIAHPRIYIRKTDLDRIEKAPQTAEYESDFELTTMQVAKRLRMSSTTVKRLRRINRLHGRKHGRTYLFKAVEVEAFEHQTTPVSSDRLSIREAKQAFGFTRDQLRYAVKRGWLVPQREIRLRCGGARGVILTFDRDELQEVSKKKALRRKDRPHKDQNGTWYPSRLAASFSGLPESTLRNYKRRKAPGLGRTIRFQLIPATGKGRWKWEAGYDEDDLKTLAAYDPPAPRPYVDIRGTWLPSSLGETRYGFFFSRAVAQRTDASDYIDGRVRAQRIRNPSGCPNCGGLLYVYHEGDFLQLVGGPKHARKRKRQPYKTACDHKADGELYDGWQKARTEKLTKCQYAARIGLTEKQVKTALHRERVRRSRLPECHRR